MVYRICTWCGHRNAPHAPLCQQCAKPLARPHAAKSRDRQPVIIAALAGALLAVVGIMAFQYSLVRSIVPAVRPAAPPPAPAPVPSHSAAGSDEESEDAAKAYADDVSAASVGSSSSGEQIAYAEEEDPDCRRGEVAAFLAETESVMAEFYDHYQRASTTSRIALSGVVGDLQAARREYQRLEPPPCADDAHKKVLLAMEGTIQGFLLFMQASGTGAEGDEIVARYFGEVGDYWKDARRELDLLGELQSGRN